MTNYKITEIGDLKNLINLENGKVFLHDKLELSGCEISLNCVPKGFKVPFKHKHQQNEEVYIVLKGIGIITVDDENVYIKEGSAINIQPNAARTIANGGDGEFMFICIQTKSNSLEQFGLGDAELV